jgi:hypothetical protein
MRSGTNVRRVGTGRIIFSLNYTEQDIEAMANRFMAAARAMQGDGWWWVDARPQKRPIKRQILREMIRHLLSGRGCVAASEAGPQLGSIWFPKSRSQVHRCDPRPCAWDQFFGLLRSSRMACPGDKRRNDAFDLHPIPENL